MAARKLTDVDLRTLNPPLRVHRKHKRKCDCGTCKTCKQRERGLRAWRRKRAGIQPLKQNRLSVAKMEAFWSKVKQ